MKKSFILFAFAAQSFAADGGLKDGLYVREFGSGQLQVSKTEVTVNTINSQGNVCEFKGPLSGKRATQKSTAESPACILGFESKKEGSFAAVEIAVLEDSWNGCNELCGLNGTLDGTFYLQPAECSSTNISQSRAQFKSAFDKKNYREAALGLNQKLSSCKPFFSREDYAWSKNDLALAQFHLGENSKCLQSIKDIESHVQQIGSEKLTKAVQFNKEKCEGKKDKPTKQPKKK